MMSMPISELSTAADIKEQVIQILCDHLDKKPEQLAPQKMLIDDLGADSISIVEIMMNLEDAFGFRIPTADAEKMKTVGDTVEYVRQHLEECA